MLLNSKWPERDLHTIAYPSVSTQVIEIDFLKKPSKDIKTHFLFLLAPWKFGRLDHRSVHFIKAQEMKGMPSSWAFIFVQSQCEMDQIYTSELILGNTLHCVGPQLSPLYLAITHLKQEGMAWVWHHAVCK